MYSYELNCVLNSKLTTFFKLSLSMLCGKCANVKFWPHHPGIINKHLSSEKDISSELEKYTDDIEHGIFHGIMTAFCAYIISSPKTREEFEQLFASCLLHDFVKSIKGLNVPGHDIKLKEFFPYLLPETYEHNLRANKHANCPLIISDRLELMRYNNYREWVDDRLTDNINILSPENKQLMMLFYDHARPALQHLYKNRKSLWIVHGIERIDKFNKESEYPYPYSCHIPCDIQDNELYKEWAATSDNIESQYYPIEHDRFPFSPAGNNLSNGFCSNHGILFSWGKLKGIIPHESFKSLNGIIHRTDVREHLYAKSNINLTEWTFLYNNLDNKNGKCKYPDITNKEIINTLENIVNIKNAKLIGQKNVFYLWNLVKLVTDRMALLNIN